MCFQAICFDVVAISIAKNVRVIISKFIMVFGIGPLSEEGAIAVIIALDHEIYLVIIQVIVKLNVFLFVADGRFVSPVPICRLTTRMMSCGAVCLSRLFLRLQLFGAG